MKKINSDNCPAAVGPYSQAIAHDGFVFVSGQLPLHPQTGQIVGVSAAEQVEQCIANLAAIAAAAGTTLAKTVKTTVLMMDLAEFAAVNEVYARHFNEPFPARACYQIVALPKGARVEVEAVFAI